MDITLEFIMHLEKIITFFNSYPDSKLQIVQKTDVICSYCPHEQVRVSVIGILELEKSIF